MEESRFNEKLAEEINFSEIDEDLLAFQEDEMVQQALHRGVDLKKYGRELEKELKQVIQTILIINGDVSLWSG